ncbi:MAG: hypothetical protein J6W42_10035 [Bacteroidaceae bacterium]|nr:hypothetical protein [Bacteroidaceae bacterium]
MLSTENLSPGMHTLGIRPYGGAGWGPTVTQHVVVTSGALEIKTVEYFWDDDPGLGNATPLPIVSSNELNLDNIEFHTDGLSTGVHSLGLRARSNMGWAPTVYLETYVPLRYENAVVTNAEYFWNEDPGFGQGTPIRIEPDQQITLESLGIPTTELNGDALLFIRYHGLMGWSPTLSYHILVNAEGNYTLNSLDETSAETRNYQSFNDAIGDFYNRGFGDDIILTLSTDGITYSFDATSDSVLKMLSGISADIDRLSLSGTGKTIGLKAAQGSDNTLSVNTTEQGLPTVLHFFARTWIDNITLIINGKNYDFTPWSTSPRYEELCSGELTQPLAIFNNHEYDMSVSFTPQPHKGTTISGFSVESSASLPSVAITNSGTHTDSLSYLVLLHDVNGQELDRFSYHFYVHPNISNQTFTNLKPSLNGILNPGEVNINWDPVPDAYVYRLSVTDLDDGVCTPETYETIETHCKIHVLSGHHYEWNVTAIGPCDELPSPVMTFYCRLLPDLTVTSIKLPEAAESGNLISVRTTITNQGEGATTESTWIDRLYYIIDSQDFSMAIEADNVTHTGILASGESYDVDFTFKVPYIEEGLLRVFVETDLASMVMESNDDNNCQISTTAATLQPFFVNEYDIDALLSLYNNLGGPFWNGIQWDISSRLITEHNWSGVSFDTEGRVTDINLQGRGLTGSLSSSHFDKLPHLSSLDLSHNGLTGDPSSLLSDDFAPLLTSLNLSYNRIDDLSTSLPENIISVDLSNQTIDKYVTLSEIIANTGQLEKLLPRPMTYNASERVFSFNGYFILTNNKENEVQSWRMDIENTILRQVTNASVVYNEENGHEVTLQVINGDVKNEMRLIVDFEPGDVNLDGLCDIADLQHLINFAINDTHPRVFFNINAGDLQPDNDVNVLDLVRLINLLLDENKIDRAPAREKNTPPGQSHSEAWIGIRNQELVLSTERPVAAFDIIMDYSEDAIIEWTLENSRWNISQRLYDGGAHVIIYSLSGEQIPAGETVLAHISNGAASLQKVTMTDINAVHIGVGIKHETTSIHMKQSDNGADVYSTEGVKQDAAPIGPGIYIIEGKKQLVK